MILSGAIVTIIGLSGLIYCILKAFRAKKSGLKGEELSKQLKKTRISKFNIIIFISYWSRLSNCGHTSIINIIILIIFPD
jgi:hypothetical protein